MMKDQTEYDSLTYKVETKDNIANSENFFANKKTNIEDEFGTKWEVMQDPENYDPDILADFIDNKGTTTNTKFVQNSDSEL